VKRLNRLISLCAVRNEHRLRRYVPKVDAAAAIASEDGAIAEPLQLGVVLKPFDNERGERLSNRYACCCRNLKAAIRQ